MNNNDGNNDPPPPPPNDDFFLPPPLAIESLEDYLQRYGLPPNNDNDDDDGRNGEFNGLNRTEAHERMQAEKAYLDAFIEKHHQEQKQQSTLATGYTPRLDGCHEKGMISITLANKKRHVVPIKPMFTYCETVRRMTVHRSRFGVAINNGSGNDSEDVAKDGNDKSSENESSDDATILELSLEEFDLDATLQFMSALQSLHDHHHKQQQQQAAASTNTEETTNSSSSSSSSWSTQLNQDEHPTIEAASCNQHIIYLIETQTITSNSIIEILKLSHFLQCNIILDTLVSIVKSSIDLENCLSICSLADALDLTSLFESSVNFVIRRLDAFQGNGGDDTDDNKDEDEWETKGETPSIDENDSSEELWKSLPHDLRSRVLTMRNILRSSIIGRGSKMSGVFFSSGNEFLAIFRETISVQKERLAEARERLEEVVRERKEEFDVKRQRRGRWFDSSVAAEEEFVYGGDVAYSMRQIDRQAKRLTTLESFYHEQQIIFSKCGGGDCELTFVSR